MYKRLHHASVHEDALFKILVHYFLPERQDSMCLLRDFVADQGRMPLPDIRRRSDNCPSFCRLQRKLVSPSDASSQYSSYGCASMSASKVNSALSSPGRFTQNPAQPRETFPLEKKRAPSMGSKYFDRRPAKELEPNYQRNKAKSRTKGGTNIFR